ncbi:unnamed protein product [Hyaloperonospora brassicae]|uniref:Uncharacterized protein n=1 Tax=Hyaloperonospora brassicae TaxID=162125 RepID=A0AAV0UPK8_HYABA|nr:unnamed protein product [Hyaloperonospora brassicae]
MNSKDAATRAAKRKHATSGGRKLMRWVAARRQLFERTLPYTTRLNSAPHFHLRAPLASIKGSGIPVEDGSISEQRLVQYIEYISS